jgi:hypothetical protein
MPITKAIAVPGVSIFAAILVTPQTTPQAESQGKASIPFIYWDKKTDLRKWLKENESRLNRGDGCALLGSYYDEDKSFRSGRYEIVSFIISPEDQEMIRVVRDSIDEDRFVEVRIGVKYTPIDSGHYLQIALASEGSPENVFVELSRAEALTIRDRHWRWLSVERQIRVGHVQYNFSLTCENGKTFMNWWRHPLKLKSRRKSLG